MRGDILGTGVAESTLPDQLDVLWTYKAGRRRRLRCHGGRRGRHRLRRRQRGHVSRRAPGRWHAGLDQAVRRTAASPPARRSTRIDSTSAILNGVVRCLAHRRRRQNCGLASWKAKSIAGPTPHGDDVLVTSESGTLACLNAADGKERWQPFRIDAPLRCSPTIAAGRVMLAGCDSLLHIIDVADGKEIAHGRDRRPDRRDARDARRPRLLRHRRRHVFRHRRAGRRDEEAGSRLDVSRSAARPTDPRGRRRDRRGRRLRHRKARRFTASIRRPARRSGSCRRAAASKVRR